MVCAITLLFSLDRCAYSGYGNAVVKAEMTSFHTLRMAVSNPFPLLILIYGERHEILKTALHFRLYSCLVAASYIIAVLPSM